MDILFLSQPVPSVCVYGVPVRSLLCTLRPTRPGCPLHGSRFPVVPKVAGEVSARPRPWAGGHQSKGFKGSFQS